MDAPRTLATRFEAYADWRRRLTMRVFSLRERLSEQELANAQVEQRFERLLEQLEHDKLIVAFVAELSRGKSELINAIFFADFGRRLLPSSAGRTTMCPTELSYDASLPPSIRLLPIETRLKAASVAELRRYPDEWVTIPLDLALAGQIADALQSVSQVKRVPTAVAARYGLAGSGAEAAEAAEPASIEIPCWRHAVINFPHPLLQQGLVVLDTPGLNATGSEPELTLDQISGAHTVLFILAADAGVTKTDLEVWTSHLAGEDPAAKASRIVVLNKIDGLWDELRGDADVDAEITRQVVDSARVLDVAPSQVYAVSAQKALLAKVNGDDALLERSRVPMLEAALSGRLVPARRDIVGGAVRCEVRAITADARALLESRRTGLALELAELCDLRGRNEDVAVHLMNRVTDEKALFERGLQRFTALRTVFTEETKRLQDCIGEDALRANAARTRRRIEASPFTRGIREAMNGFFGTIRADFERGAKTTGDIQELMRSMYARFAEERSLGRFDPPGFSMLRYQKEIERLERAYNTHFNTLWNMVSKAKFALMRRFFETIASRVEHVYEIANRDAHSWLRSVMSPLEGQVRELHAQLRRRVDSIKQIQGASGEMETRVAELEAALAAIDAQVGELERDAAAVEAIIAQPEMLPRAANA
jgi:CII-binding regulator of phage lambda lysogenization HflD